MRYYAFLVKTNEEKIRKNTSIRYSEYCCDSGVSTVNAFVQRHAPNGLSFFIYKVEGETAHAVFAFNVLVLVQVPQQLLLQAFIHLQELQRLMLQSQLMELPL